MKLLILSDGHVWKNDGLCWSRDPWLKIAGHLEPFFSSVLVCVPLRPGSDNDLAIGLNRDWKNDRIHWVHTFPHESVINYYKFLPLILIQNLPIIAKAVRDSDIVFMRLPAMNGFLTMLLAKIFNKPLFCYFSGDQKVQILKGGKYRGIWSLPAKAVAIFHDFLNLQLVRASRASMFEAEASLQRFGSTNKNCLFMFPSVIEEGQIRYRSWAEGSARRNLLYVGRISAEKGLEFLLKAMAQLLSENTQCRLNICGDGPQRAAMEDLAAKLGLGESVNFVGHVQWGNSLDCIYSESDILVIPSLSEGVPKVALEAMANGVAVIATEVGGLPRIICDKKNGMLVPPASSSALAHAIKKLLADQNLRNQVIHGGYQFIREHTDQKQAEKIASIMLEHVETRPADDLRGIKRDSSQTSDPYQSIS